MALKFVAELGVHRQPSANNSKQSDAGVIEVTFSSQKPAERLLSSMNYITVNAAPLSACSAQSADAPGS
jgi:hypothetical protein